MSIATVETSGQVETVTPDIAREWLATSPGNRPTNERWVDALADMQTSGNFVITGEPLIFDEDNRLMDGHHRLLAVLKSGCTVQFMVVRGIPRAYFAKINRGRIRTFANIANLAGYKNDSRISAAASHLYSWLAGELQAGASGAIASKMRFGKLWSPEKMLGLIAAHPGLEDAIPLSRDVCKAIGAAPSSIICMIYITRAGDVEFSTEFWNGVCTGDMLAKSDPRIRLRETMIGWRMRGLRIKPYLATLAIVKSWNAFVCARPMMLLRATMSEPMPSVELVSKQLQYASLDV